MRDRLKESHPFSFSKDWPENPVVNSGMDKQGYPYKTPVNTNRMYNPTWIPMDTQENYNRLKKKGYYSSNKFAVESFKYELNKHGFRCDDFNTIDFSKKSIVYLGCSHTFGIGSPEEDIWCSMLHKLLQEHYNTEFNLINLGVPGGSIDDYLRFIPYFKKFNPYMIISGNPAVHRMIIPHSSVGNPHSSEPILGYYSVGCESTPGSKGFRELLKYSDEYFIYKYNMTLEVVKSITDEMNIEFYESNILTDTEVRMEKVLNQIKELKPSNTTNRDGGHYNRLIHEIVTSFYFEMITEREENVYTRKN